MTRCNETPHISWVQDNVNLAQKIFLQPGRVRHFATVLQQGGKRKGYVGGGTRTTAWKQLAHWKPAKG
jgi:hypothetical protein